MHKSSSPRTLFKFEPKIEHTFHKLKRQQKIQEEQEVANPKPRMAGEDEQRMTIRGDVTPGVYDMTPSITRLLVNAKNFELKPVLISMVQRSEFGGTFMEDPSFHLSIFLEM